MGQSFFLKNQTLLLCALTITPHSVPFAKCYVYLLSR